MSCPINSLLAFGLGVIVSKTLLSKMSNSTRKHGDNNDVVDEWPSTGNPHILIAGGAGYIASHTIVCLLSKGYDVTIVDNLMNSNEESINRVRNISGITSQSPRLRVYIADMCDIKALENVFNTSPVFTAVMHFAGLKAVGESVAKPLLYYENNLVSTLNLLNMMGTLRYCDVC